MEGAHALCEDIRPRVTHTAHTDNNQHRQTEQGRGPEHRHEEGSRAGQESSERSPEPGRRVTGSPHASIHGVRRRPGGPHGGRPRRPEPGGPQGDECNGGRRRSRWRRKGAGSNMAGTWSHREAGTGCGPSGARGPRARREHAHTRARAERCAEARALQNARSRARLRSRGRDRARARRGRRSDCSIAIARDLFLARRVSFASFVSFARAPRGTATARSPSCSSRGGRSRT